MTKLGKSRQPTFAFTPVSKLMVQPKPLCWLLKGYLLPGSLCLLFGEPAAGKSLIALDWAASITTGRSWCKCRVTLGPVIYVAGEGQFGICRRLKAWALHHKCEEQLTNAHLFVSDTGASLLQRDSLDAVVTAVDDIAAKHGNPTLIVIDTLHRNLGPGDENSAKDMSMFVQVMDALRIKYKATILIVHHTGHGNKGRARGSSSLKAAVDAEFQLETGSEDERVLTVTKMKDGPTPDPMGFRLLEVTLPWLDEDGIPEPSVVLEPTGAPVASKKTKMPRDALMGFEALVAALEAHGTAPNWKSKPDESQPNLVVQLERWRTEFYARKKDVKQDSKKTAFNRARQALIDKQAISTKQDHFWPTPTNSQWPQLMDKMPWRILLKMSPADL